MRKILSRKGLVMGLLIVFASIALAPTIGTLNSSTSTNKTTDLITLLSTSTTTEGIEPNNDFNQAIALKEIAEGTVSSDDPKDIYKFYVEKGLDIRLKLIATNNIDLYLYSPERQMVAKSCNRFSEYIAHWANVAGYWYAEVKVSEKYTEYAITVTLVLDQNDGGYDGDAGNNIFRSVVIFPMEPIDNTPGRGMEGMLSPPGDGEDWYMFSVCEGQTIDITMTPTEDYDLEILDNTATVIASSYNSDTTSESISYIATETINYYMRIFAKDETGEGTYTMDIELQGHNDANSGRDAGDTIDDALQIIPGEYCGFLGFTDLVDWYAFQVDAGQGIRAAIEVPIQSDYNLWLYTPDDNLVHSASHYGDDVLEYPAHVTGLWKLKVDMFPGFDEKWNEYPVPYYKYGSGAYTLTVAIGGSMVSAPVIPQPNVVPVAQTIIVNNDPGGNKDEYCYIAAVPTSNYIEDGTRYVAPIVYNGDDTITNWFGTVDDTTGYLLEDWDEYLTHFEKTAEGHTMDNDPVIAAANLAEKMWNSSTEAVVVVDGSNLKDEITDVLSTSATLNIQTNIKRIRGDSDKFKEIDGNLVYPFFVGKKWGVMNVAFTETGGNNYEAEVITPNYMASATDWWPEDENKDDIWQPIIFPGIYGIVTSERGDHLITATMLSCDRYKIPVADSASTLTVTIETDEPSYLWVYLIDPRGNIIAPDIPSWSGADIKPIHQWHGNKTAGDEQEYNQQVIEPHTTFSAEINYPLTGDYTAIVVPRKEMSGSVSYNIKAEIRTYNSQRIAYGLSAANGAVLGSLKHVPLLYANEDSVPDETTNVLNTLDVSNVIFVDLGANDIVAGELSANYEIERLSSINGIVNIIQQLNSEDYLTITSFASGDGYFAPASYLAAYHGAPVVDIGDMGEAYHWGNVAHQWMFYAGDYYHGARSIGHLPMAEQPIADYIQNLEVPPIGLDAELRWYRNIIEDVYAYAENISIDISGMEAYGFVSPKSDIRFTVHRALLGNLSTAGQFIGKTTGEMAAYITRSVLYPALIFANNYKEITTTSFINYGAGWEWVYPGSDGNTYTADPTKDTLQYLRAFGREYRGHCVWDNTLVEQNRGASIYFYFGHGTGGGGVGGHPKTAGIGTDGWRGYEYWQGHTPRYRSGRSTAYNPEPPEEYDVVHFKWCDQLWQNLHSCFVGWHSCTTFAHFGPEIYLEHGAVAAYGNANTGSTPPHEILNTFFMENAFYEGKPIGVAYSEVCWIIERDFTAADSSSIYGPSGVEVDGDMVIYGDPMLVVYSPQHWIEPTPIDSKL